MVPGRADVDRSQLGAVGARPHAQELPFSSHVADLAAPLRSMSKDALVGEDIRQHRRSVRLAWGEEAERLERRRGLP